MPPLIAIIAADHAELEPLEPAIELLREVECPCEILVAPVWTRPAEIFTWAAQVDAQGIRVIIATAGRLPHLPGLLAAATRLPVLALPLALGNLAEGELVLAALATAPTAPVAAVEPGAADSAALLALRMLAMAEPAWRGALEHLQRRLEKGGEPVSRPARLAPATATPGRGHDDLPVNLGPTHPTSTKPVQPAAKITARETAADDEDGADAAAEAQHARYVDDEASQVEVRPIDFTQPLSGPVVGVGQAGKQHRADAALPLAGGTDASSVSLPARRLGRRRIDPDSPDVELIEETVDCLLEGGVIALPTDTVYGLAVDATNARALEALLALKHGAPQRGLSLLVDSPKLLAGIVCNLTIEVRHLMEAFWPGPLTILFQKRAGNFAHVNAGESIAVRMPDHSVPLAIMQALARPLAIASAGLGGAEPLTANAVADLHGDRLNILLDTGTLPEVAPSTVLDVTVEPYRVLREGGVTHAQLSAIVGDKLQLE